MCCRHLMDCFGILFFFRVHMVSLEFLDKGSVLADENVDLLLQLHWGFGSLLDLYFLGWARWCRTKRSRWSKGENYTLASTPKDRGAGFKCRKATPSLDCETDVGNGFVFQGIRGEPGELLLSSPWSTVGRRPEILFILASQIKVLFTTTAYNRKWYSVIVFFFQRFIFFK